MTKPKNDPSLGDDTPDSAVQPQDALASPEDTVVSEDDAAEQASGDEDAMIDVIVMGPVLGAKTGAIISVTPEVFADYEPYLRRID